MAKFKRVLYLIGGFITMFLAFQLTNFSSAATYCTLYTSYLNGSTATSTQRWSGNCTPRLMSIYIFDKKTYGSPIPIKVRFVSIGISDKSLTWTVDDQIKNSWPFNKTGRPVCSSGNCGTVSADGVFTPPQVSKLTYFRVRASSKSNPSIGDYANITVYPSKASTCAYTYSNWGECSSDGTQTRAIASASPSGCTGNPVLSRACSYTPPTASTCTSFDYSAWSACGSENTHTRAAVSSYPAGCTGGNPVLTESCSYTAPTCTSFNYSSWGACGSSNTQTRTVISSGPAGCAGGNPVLTQSCSYSTPTCTSFNYSAWGTCQPSNTQTRTVLSSEPSGCAGGSPVLTQSCTYTQPVTAKAVTPGTSWQWQLTGTIDTSFDVKLYDIDLFDTSASTIQSLKNSGKKVICYFSAGSGENWRSDYTSIPSAALGNNLDGWAGEKWLDTRSEGVRNVMAARMDLAVSKGCDGVEPDNVDGYTNNPGFPLTAATQLDYNKFLAQTAHNKGLLVAMKNDLDQVSSLVSYFDFMILEECFKYNECDLAKPFISANKAVLEVEYGGQALVSKYCSKANTLNFDTLIKNLDLDATRISCR